MPRCTFSSSGPGSVRCWWKPCSNAPCWDRAAHELALARLHWQVDKLVELPLLIAVVASGAKLLRDVQLDGLLRAKLACAALAVFANLYCIWLVRLRLKVAEAGAWELFAMIDRRQHQIGALVLIGLLGAAGLAIAL